MYYENDRKVFLIILCFLFIFTGENDEPRARGRIATWDWSKTNLSNFYPANPKIPTGDTIKIAVVTSYSGPAKVVGGVECVVGKGHSSASNRGVILAG